MSDQKSYQTTEIYKRLRPTLFKHVYGQDAAVAQLEGFLKKNSVPHTLLFSGPSGTGKTTLARILATKMGAKGGDLNEANCARMDEPKKELSIIQRQAQSKCLDGNKARVWILDEFQSLSRSGFSQQSVLKMLEDMPNHAYFFLCATDTDKIIQAIKTRATRIVLKSIPALEQKKLLSYVCEKENITITEKVKKKLIEDANGSARQLLVFLEQTIAVGDDEEKQLALSLGDDVEKQADQIVKKLLWEKVTWDDMRKLLNSLVIDDPENLRHYILAMASKELRKDKANYGRAAAIIARFQYNFYDTKRAGLDWCCFDLIASSKRQTK